MFGRAKGETTIPTFVPQDSLEKMGAWPLAKWCAWLPERVKIYFEQPFRYRREILFSPFIIYRSYEPIATQMHDQILEFLPAAAANIGAIARDGAMRWTPKDGEDVGRFYISLTGLCEAANLADMVRAIDEKFPLDTPWQQLEPVFASVTDYVLDNLTGTEARQLFEEMRDKRGEQSPVAYMGRIEWYALKRSGQKIPEPLQRWDRPLDQLTFP